MYFFNIPTSVEKHPQITPGTYKGKMSGYSLKIIFNNGKESEHIKMNEGIRGINCEVDVEVHEEGFVTVNF